MDHVMKRLRISAALLLLAAMHSVSFAGCSSSDRWVGSDKTMHLAAGALVSVIGTVQTGSQWQGFAIGAGVGIAKEMLDANGMGRCTFQDAAVTVLGAAIGAYTGGLILTHSSGKTTVAYAKSF